MSVLQLYCGRSSRRSRDGRTPGRPFVETIDPVTGLVTVVANLLSTVGEEPCSAAVTKESELLLLCRTPPPAIPPNVIVRLWLVSNLDTMPTATLLSQQTGGLNAGNMASCPFLP